MQITTRSIFAIRTEFICDNVLSPRVLLTSTNGPFFTLREKEHTWFGSSTMELARIKAAAQKILKKTRISQSEKAYDLLTFSHKFIDDFGSFFETLQTLTRGQVFSQYTVNKVEKEGLATHPIWFHSHKNAHFSEWIVQ